MSIIDDKTPILLDRIDKIGSDFQRIRFWFDEYFIQAYYSSLLSVNLLRIRLSPKLHMDIVQNVLLTTLPSLFIITGKVSASFFILVLNIFFLNFFSCYLLTVERKVSFTVGRKVSFSTSPLKNAIWLFLALFDYFCKIILHTYIYIYIYKLYTKLYIESAILIFFTTT